MAQATIPGWTWVASLAVHGALIGGFGWLALVSLRPQRPLAPLSATPSQSVDVLVDLPKVAEGTLRDDQTPDPVGEPPHRGAGAVVARIDSGRKGRGGEATVAERAVHLSDVDEGTRRSLSIVSRLDRDQVQRIRSGADRSSREDRRSTTHPMELTFVATGPGTRDDRRAPSVHDPSRGAALAAAAARVGGVVGSVARDEGDGPRAGAARDGMRLPSPGLGVPDGAIGIDHETRAAVRTARPDVFLGAVQVEALKRARPRDDVDSDQEVATRVQSLVHESTAGGAVGVGAGGTQGGGAPGAGGAAGAGSHPAPLGLGEGDTFDFNTTDPRLISYFRRLHAKIDPLWANAFPKSALLELKQGTVILEFTIRADGTAQVAWPPARPSGIDEFDRNCAAAIRKAAPFDPIPKDLGVTSLRVRAPFVADNPIVK